MTRGIDLALAILGAIVTSPLMILIGLAVLLTQGRPVLFWQTRVGRGGRTFSMPKFRSMREAFDASGNPLPDEQRVTGIGRFLRRFRVDELPGLFSIIIGDMAVVGPRPLPRSVVEKMPRHGERTSVRPGLTGLAQVSGNTLLDPREKVALDLLYVQTRSALVDLTIIMRTLVTLARGERRDEPAIRRALAQFDERDFPPHGEAAAR